MTPTRTMTRADPRTETTRAALVAAAVATLKEEGYGGSTARSIANRAGCNQALVFYHFGSVVDLLLVALDDVSRRRRERFDAALLDVSSPSDLVALGTRIFREDLDSGDAAVLVAMIAGAASTPGLAPKVKERMAPWIEFATGALSGVLRSSPLASLATADEIAYATVAFYLGLELITHLDGDQAPAVALFGRAAALAPMLDTLAPGARS